MWINRYSAGMRIRFDGKRRITSARDKNEVLPLRARWCPRLPTNADKSVGVLSLGRVWSSS